MAGEQESNVTHALVPIQLWGQIKAYISSVPTGSVPLQQAAMMMQQIEQVQGCSYDPENGKNDDDGKKKKDAAQKDDGKKTSE